MPSPKPTYRFQVHSLPSFDGEPLHVVEGRNSRLFCRNTVVFVHGLDNTATVWQALMAEILDRCPSTQCLAFDARGHGSSSYKYAHLVSGYDHLVVPATITRPDLLSPPAARLIVDNLFTPEELTCPTMDEVWAADLNHLINTLAKNRPVLVGHSFGGLTIQTYLNQQTSPFFKPSRRLFPPRAQFILASNLHTFRLPRFNRRIASRLLYQTMTQTKIPTKIQPQFEDYLAATWAGDLNPASLHQALTSVPLRGLALNWLSVLNWFNPQPQNLNLAPTTLVYGRHDRLFRPGEIEAEIRAHHFLKGIKLDDGHKLIFTQLPVLSHLLLDFLQGKSS